MTVIQTKSTVSGLWFITQSAQPGGLCDKKVELFNGEIEPFLEINLVVAPSESGSMSIGICLCPRPRLFSYTCLTLDSRYSRDWVHVEVRASNPKLSAFTVRF